MGIFFILMIFSGGFLLYLFLSIVSKKPASKNPVKVKKDPSANISVPKPGNATQETISLPIQKILFDAGMDHIQEQAEEKLLELVQFLLESPSLKIQIIGISDSTGNQSQNRILAKSRASKVYQYIKGKGIDSSRLDTDILPSSPGITAKERENLRAVRFKII
ncbi:MAG: OmpA family protein [Leptospiraceae bacterium]|nr:OmpA family protein [Leptospiraceae bacterium]